MKEFESQIIFEDNHILVINKRSSQIVHGDKTGDDSLVDMIKDYLREKYNKPGNIYCGVAHRLDRPVSGAIVFAKTEKALVRLNKSIHDRLFSKKYWAVVRNAPPKDEDTLTNYLIKDEGKNKSYITKDTTRGLRAELRYRLLAKSDFYNLLEVELLTGRHHQIRVQLASIGCPIKGDLKYGFGRSNKVSSICLHARELSFEHPTTKEHMTFIAPVPDEPLWRHFEESVIPK
ncbi:MAG: pseudouridine synthase [Bacteroidetes bacterium]|nr:pseudouridine synthase [Bacteroidota bacterium]